MGEVDPRTPLLPGLASLPGHLLWRASARVHAAAATALPPEVDLHAFTALAALPPPTTHSQQELADVILVSRQTLVHTAADLAARGLVDRHRNPADRRSYVLTRTPAGTDAVRRWAGSVADLEARLLQGFGEAERAQFVDLLAVVVHHALSDVRIDLPAGTLAEELDRRVGFLITRGHAALHRRFLTALAPLDLEPRDFGSLRALRELGAVPQADLARALGVSGPTVVEIVDRLEERGLAVRTPDPADRRTHRLQITPGATPVLRQALRSVRLVEDEALAPLDHPGRARLVDLLRRFVVAAT